MSTGHSAPCFVQDRLAALHDLLRRLTLAALHVQLRARFQANRPQKPASRAGATAHAAIDGQASLRAMSHYCLEQLMPPVSSLMTQIDAAAALAAALAREGPEAELAARLNDIAASLERARGSSRGRDRTPRNSAGMIRLSEQRLWGALAVELQRLDGADGPTIRACAQVEAAAFDLAAAIEAFLEHGEGMALAQRHDLAHVLVRLESQAAGQPLSVDQIGGKLGPLAARLPEMAGLFARLSQAYHPLRETRPQIATVLSIATRTAIQSGATLGLEQVMQDLDRLLSGLAPNYRALARSAQRPQGQAAARQRILAEAPQWRETARLLAAPLALVSDMPESGADAGADCRAGQEGPTLLRA